MVMMPQGREGGRISQMLPEDEHTSDRHKGEPREEKVPKNGNFWTVKLTEMGFLADKDDTVNYYETASP